MMRIRASRLLFNDAVCEMGDPFADAHLRVFQGNGCYLEMFKQADTVTKQEWYQVDVDFVEQSSVEALLHNRRGSYHDVFDACDHFCLFNSAFNAISYESHRPFLLDPFRWGSMGHDNDRGTHGMVASPSSGELVQSASGHYCSGRVDGVIEPLDAFRCDLEFLLLLAYREGILGIAARHPGKEVLEVFVGPGDKTVQGH